jgi:protein-S-isoprenylcysteine O-methyltransferase
MRLSAQLGLVYFASEVALRFLRRSGKGVSSADRGSLALLWGAIGLAVSLGIAATYLVPSASFPLAAWARGLVTFMFILGLVIRWWSILALGKFFTVDVAIAPDHQLVARGPYRFVRHPSYSGLMLAFVAFAVTLQNGVALGCVLVPISLALAYRIRVEEAVLLSAFGDDYRRYSKTTKRLVPGVL